MEQADRVQAWLCDGTLVPPKTGDGGFVGLVRAILRLGGCEGVSADDGCWIYEQRLGKAERYLVVLVDGLGENLLTTLPATSFLRSHRRYVVHTVFPSTTAAVLTTVATAQWPAEHAVVGWWTRLPHRSLSAVTLPFVERSTERSLKSFGVRPEELYPELSVWPRFSRGVCSILPRGICSSVYTRYACGGTRCMGYRGLLDAVEMAAALACRADGPAITYLYLPELDTLMHEKGTDSPETAALLLRMDRLLGQLASAVAGCARIVVTADHGLADVTPEHRRILALDDPLVSLLRCQPSGEARVPFFHVRVGKEDRFKRSFLERFGEDYALVTPEEAQVLGLFGPVLLGAKVRPRLGTFIGISRVAAKFYVEPCGRSAEHVGAHGGLLPCEMLVPLVIA